MLRFSRVSLAAVMLALTFMVGTTYAHEASPPSVVTTVERIPADPQECAQYLKDNPGAARQRQGCWFELTTTVEVTEISSGALGVSTATAYHGGGYVYFDTYMKLGGPFNVWWVEARGEWRANGNHIYEEDTWCPYFAWGYGIDGLPGGCGVKMRDDYPYLIYGADFRVTSGPFTWGHGMRMRVYASTATCCLTSY